MANFGIYFDITNELGVPLVYLRGEFDHGVYDGPTKLPSQEQPQTVHVADPDFARGAGATLHYLAVVDGVAREYTWTGDCPLIEDNTWGGPGIVSTSGKTGHPLTITIFVDKSTPGWRPFGDAADDSTSLKSLRAKAAGKTEAVPNQQIKV